MYGSLKQLAAAAAVTLVFTTASAGSTDSIIRLPAESQGSTPAELTASGEYLYFTADDGIHGRELWKLDRDGEASLVFDHIPGPDGSELNSLRDVGGTLFFFSHLGHLWRTEGSPETTLRLSRHALVPMAATGLGSKLLFTADDNVHGAELWVSGGTPESTHILREGQPGPDSAFIDWEGMLIRFDNRIFFATSDRELGPTIWVTDGTASGTMPVLDQAGTPVPAFRGLTFFGMTIGDALYFNTGDPESLIWKVTRGSEVAQPLPDSHRGAKYKPASLGRAGGSLVMRRRTDALGWELWGLSPPDYELGLIADIHAGPSSSSPYNQRPVGDLSVFVADHPDYGVELWRTDGTREGTALLKDLVAGTQSSEPYQLLPYKDWVLFSCENYAIGEELWRTDGTTEGTVLLKDINPKGDAEPYYLEEFNGKVYFSANHYAYGEELWETDGTPEGTRLAARMKPALRAIGSSYPRDLTPLGDTLYFTAIGRTGERQIWATRGTGAAPLTGASSAIPPRERYAALFGQEKHLYAETVNGGGQRSYWKIDTERGSAIKLEGRPVSGDGGALPAALTPAQVNEIQSRGLEPGQWALAGETLCFPAYMPEYGTELWAIEGEGSTPSLLLDIFPGPASASPGGLYSVGASVLFRAEDTNKGCELWITDGTSAGTRLVADFLGISPAGSRPADYAATDNDNIYLVARTDLDVSMLIKLTGSTYSGYMFLLPDWLDTVMRPEQLTAVGNTVYFVSPHPLYGTELWKNTPEWLEDGSGEVSGVCLVDDIQPNVAYNALERGWTSP